MNYYRIFFDNDITLEAIELHAESESEAKKEALSKARYYGYNNALIKDVEYLRPSGDMIEEYEIKKYIYKKKNYLDLRSSFKKKRGKLWN